jgi:hypothetical protein
MYEGCAPSVQKMNSKGKPVNQKAREECLSSHNGFPGDREEARTNESRYQIDDQGDIPTEVPQYGSSQSSEYPRP